MDQHTDPFGTEHGEDVGDSPTRSAEEVAREEQEAGRMDTGTKGASERPTGTSNPRDFTGIDPQDPITREDDTPSG